MGAEPSKEPKGAIQQNKTSGSANQQQIQLYSNNYSNDVYATGGYGNQVIQAMYGYRQALPSFSSPSVIQRAFESVAHSEAGGEGSDAMGDPAAGLASIMCEFMPDSTIITLIKDYFHFRYPLAYDHLIHYLSGAGGGFDEDVEALFEENPRAASRVAGIIRREGTQTGVYRGPDPVTAPIRQADLDSENWRLSVGNIDEVSWEILSEADSDGYALVRITIRDPYHWSPEADRNTDCLHEVMERQKENGAAEFESIGVGDVRLRVRDPQ